MADRPVGLLGFPPPAAEHFDVVLGGEADCPPAYAACLSPASAEVVSRTIGDLRAYAARAWELCRPREVRDAGAPDPAHPP